MNREQFFGKWHEFKGKIKQKWGKFTDNEISQINGSYERVVGLLQKHYGYAKEQAEKELNHWCASHEKKEESQGEFFWKKDEKQQKPSHKDQEKKRKAG